jgi:hypothetical protein
MEGVLPERNHAVKFVAVYDDGTDSHAVMLPTHLFDIVNIKLKPCLWDRNAVRPRIFSETRLTARDKSARRVQDWATAACVILA